MGLKISQLGATVPQGSDNVALERGGTPPNFKFSLDDLNTFLNAANDIVQDRILGRAVGAGTGPATPLEGADVMAIIGAALDIVLDPTPKLGGPLETDGKDIFSASGDIKVHPDGSLIIELGDGSGGTSLILTDNLGGVVARIDSDGTIYTNNGSTSEPAHSFTTDLDTGMMRAAANELGFVVGGAMVIRLKLLESLFGDAVSQHGIHLRRGDAVAKIPYMKIDASDGTPEYLYLRNNGTLAISSAIPITDADGGAIPRVDIPGEWSAQQNFNAVPLTGLGVDSVINGIFAADTNWTKGTGYSIAAGVAHSDGTQGADSDLTPNVSLGLTSGKTYQVVFDVLNYVAGNVTAVIGSTEGTDRAANGTFTQNIVAGAGGTLNIRADLNFIGDIDNVTVRLANVSWDLNIAQIATLELDGDLVLDNPTNLKDGSQPLLRVNQNATGGWALTYGNAYKFPGGTAPDHTTGGALAEDEVGFDCKVAHMNGNFAQDYS